MRPKGLEPPAHCLEGSCSIHLSYGRTLLSRMGSFMAAALCRHRLRENNPYPSHSVKENLKKMWAEIELHDTKEKPSVKYDPEPEQKKNIFTKLLTGTDEENITHIAFINRKTPETSSWTYAHELGRLYLKDAFHGSVQTKAYDNISGTDNAIAAIEQAIADGNEMIFTTSPEFLSASLRAAVDHPEVKILNCSLNASHKYIRTYYGRMYEAKFLIGVLAGVMTDTDKIGYIADYPIYGMTANINAFALGVKMVNPKAKVYLEWSTLKENEHVDLTGKLYALGATYISHQDMIIPRKITRQFWSVPRQRRNTCQSGISGMELGKILRTDHSKCTERDLEYRRKIRCQESIALLVGHVLRCDRCGLVLCGSGRNTASAGYPAKCHPQLRFQPV